MRRTILFTFALWTLLAVPHLCLAGVITHACPTDDGANCSHEEMCASDPCSQDARLSASQPSLPSPDLSHLEMTALFAPQFSPPQEIGDRFDDLPFGTPSAAGSAQFLPLLI